MCLTSTIITGYVTNNYVPPSGLHRLSITMCFLKTNCKLSTFPSQLTLFSFWSPWHRTLATNILFFPKAHQIGKTCARCVQSNIHYGSFQVLPKLDQINQ